MKYVTICLPLALLASACDAGGSASTTSGTTPTNPKAGPAPAQRIDPDQMMKGPPIGNGTAQVKPNAATPAHP